MNLSTSCPRCRRRRKERSAPLCRRCADYVRRAAEGIDGIIAGGRLTGWTRDEFGNLSRQKIGVA